MNNIMGADFAGIQLLSTYNKENSFFSVCY